MKILVSGGAGFISSHTIDVLSRKVYEVRILAGLFSPIHPNREKTFLIFPGMRNLYWGM